MQVVFSLVRQSQLLLPPHVALWIVLGMLSTVSSLQATLVVVGELPTEVAEADVIVYGGTSAGVAAAIQVRQMGKSVILIEPSQHLGGLTSGGLGATDIGNKAAIGGLSREFYRRVRQHYENQEAWRFEQPEDYRSSRWSDKEDTMWTFEPHVAEAIMETWVEEADVTVVRGERLNRETGVSKQGTRITMIEMESGKRYRGQVFIDATYEGDLLAAAGVSYIVGREANEQYDESLNGVQTYNAVYHQFAGPVDPYVEAGNPESGLLPGIDPDGPGEEGSGDHRVQAYCFRMCLTDVTENQIPFQKPEGYDPLEYELLFRNFEAGADRIPWSPILMPNRKTDTNNNRGVSTDYIGMSYDWPEADYETREKIYQQHLRYQQGLMWTLANHPRVPEWVRKEVSRWGNCKDEFVENGGWSHQLYVREARRMIGGYVMTQHDCQGFRQCEDAIGLAAYTMDSHHVQRYINEEGHVRNEGDVQVGGFPPYPISYRSLVPKSDEVTNLGVPACLSASHIAFGSIRMEPVFMVLGQSIATAACLAIDADATLQEVDYEKLREQLLKDGQVLKWTEATPAAVNAIQLKELAGVVVDDAQAKKSPGWTPSRSTGTLVGQFYLHDNNDGKGERWIEFPMTVGQQGDYALYLAYSPHENRASNVPVTIQIGERSEEVRVDQRKQPPHRKAFLQLGEYALQAGDKIVVRVTNKATDGYVIADAVWLTPVED